METFVTGRIQPVQRTLRMKRFSPVGQNTILAFRSQLMEKYPCRYKFNGQQRYCSYCSAFRLICLSMRGDYLGQVDDGLNGSQL